LIDSVIRRIRRPASSKAKYDRAERQYAPHLGRASRHRDSHEVTAVSEDAQENKEYDGSWDPGPEFVSVDNLVAEGSNDEGAYSDDDNTCRTFDIVVHCLKKLSSHDRIDRRPANAGQNVEERNWGSNCQYNLYDRIDQRTQFYAVPPEPESRKHHLPPVSTVC
jgi:hypothetical protein